MRIGASELVEQDNTPEITRWQAFARPGLWTGTARTTPRAASGWHHHGGHESVLYMLSGRLTIEFGEEGELALEGGPGDFLVIPEGLVHREITASDEPAEMVVFRSGGDGPPTVNVDGPDG